MLAKIYSKSARIKSNCILNVCRKLSCKYSEIIVSQKHISFYYKKQFKTPRKQPAFVAFCFYNEKR